MSRLPGGLAAVIVGTATAVVIAAVSILLFLNPPWVAFAQERADARAWTGYTEPQLREATDAILADLVLGPPDFDVRVDGTPVLDEREREHMRDVRGVFAAFYLVAAVASVVLVAAWASARGRARFWSRVSRGGLALAMVTVVGGGLGMAYFDAAFTLFHELFFPAGSWSFDPASERLVQLFPYAFWTDTSIALGAVLVVAGVAVWWLARRRAAAAREGSPGPAAARAVDLGARP